MQVEELLKGKVMLTKGDCLDVLKELPANFIDAAVTDPPYHLTSNVKRPDESSDEDKAEAHAAFNQRGGDPYSRHGRGFIGQVWDGGDIAFRPETWEKVYRVLKPGGHLLAFGIPKHIGLLQVALQEAGFEFRDIIVWMFSQGFPKSHDLKHYPICECDHGNQTPKYDLHAVRQDDLSQTISDGQKSNDFLLQGLSQQDLPQHRTTRSESQSGRPQQPGVDRGQLYRAGEGLSNGVTAGSSESEGKRLRAGAHLGSREEIRESTVAGRGSASHQSQQSGQSTREFADIQQPSRTLDDRALRGSGSCPRCGKLKKEYAGYGTSLKPAIELLVLARKPLSEKNIAANVLRWGTGAINVDGCRVGSRWPANLLHDGSDEAVAIFPGDEGLFFYACKADADDRIGARHPTVKPLDLMQYLVRLVTPKGGVVLDPFAGTGTTGEAAWREGMRAVLIEREPQYWEDIRRRMEHAWAGPDERMREAIKARGLLNLDPGPLFGGTDTPPVQPEPESEPEPEPVPIEQRQLELL